MAEISPHTRLRPSPFYDATVADGVRTFVSYNQMLLPTGFGNSEEEYRRLTEGVSMWDVAAERQIRLQGPDAARLAQTLCARDLSTSVAGQGKYVAICNHDGTLINDPIALKIDDECFWLSIADSDMWLWATCVAAERRMDVTVDEPDVSPLAVQGPLAADVVASIVGEWVRDLKYFWFGDAEIDGIPLKVARSGYSKQGGFELYLLDGSRATDLWNIVKEAGQPFGIGPGYPHPAERIESGLLSCLGDSDRTTNPFEVGMKRFVNLDVPDDVIGIQALRQIAAEGPKRHLLGVVLDGDEPRPGHQRWYAITFDGARIGSMTNGTWSFKLKRNIGFGLVSIDAEPGSRVQVHKEGEVIDATLTSIPFERGDQPDV